MSDRKFSELIHGNIKAMKEQETIRRARGKSVMVIDPEAVSFLEESHYAAHALLVNAMRGGMGHGKVLNFRRSLPKKIQVLREMSAASPAKAAELRHTKDNKTDFAQALVRMWDREREYRRRHRHLNWGFYHGRGA